VAARLRRAFGAEGRDLAARLDAIERWRYGPEGHVASPDWAGVRDEARRLAGALILVPREIPTRA